MRTTSAILAAVLIVTAVGCKRNVVIKSSLAPEAVARTAVSIETLQTALRRAANAQEIYYSNPANRSTYASQTSKLGVALPDGVALTILEATSKGWAGMTRYGRSGPGCVMFVAQVSKVPVTPGGITASKEGVLECDRS